MAVFTLALTLTLSQLLPVSALTLNEIRQQKEEAEAEKKNTEGQLDRVESDIENIEEEQEILSEEIAQIDEQLFGLLLEVELIKSDIESKKAAIEKAKQEYEAAVEQEKNQQEAMVRRIKFMYEKGNESYLEMLIESKSMAEAVNKLEYSEKLYEYDRVLLEKYQFSKQEVAEKQTELENDLSELEEIEEDYEIQQEELNMLLEEKQETMDDFDEQLSSAKEKVSEYKEQIAKQTENLKKISEEEQAKIVEEARKKAEEEARKKAEEAARKKAEEEALEKATLEKLTGVDSDEDSTGTAIFAGAERTVSDKKEITEVAPTPESKPLGTTVTATGSGLGTDIANYALQFVGGPYVAGGTSLTQGCDCSGFTQGVYSHFGISIPRSSYAQSEGGTAVSVDAMQAGDIIYYGGHVAIYIGNSQIVHASTAATGIKVSNVFYRSIITVRRYY